MIYLNNVALLQAALQFVSKEESRPALQYVRLEPAEGEGLLLTATDGRCLFHAFDPRGYLTDAQSVSVRPGAKVPARLWKGGPGTVEDGLLVTTAEDFVPLEVSENEFPDYRQITWAGLEVERAHYNPDLLKRFNDVGARLHGSNNKVGKLYARVTPHGLGPGVVHFPKGVQALGLIMPMRTDHADFEMLGGYWRST